MAQINKKANDIEAIGDDELNAVAGGVDLPDRMLLEDITEFAASEGRKIKVTGPNRLCGCPSAFLFAESYETLAGGRYVFHNVCCYNCGGIYDRTG